MKKPENGNERTQASRRRFLTGVAAAGGATAAVVATGALAATTEGEPQAPVEQAASAGYEETAHVRAYYRTARM